MSPKRLFLFGEYRLDQGERQLLRGTEAVPLPPKLFDLLSELVGNPGRLLPKQDLLDKVWPGVAVEEGSLTRGISYLRQVLGSTADGRDYIQTVSKGGYRFVAEVREIADGEPDGTRPAGGIPLPPSPGATEDTAAPMPRRRRARWLGAAFAGVALTAVLIAIAPTLQHRAAPASGIPIKSLAVLPLANLTGDPTQDYFSDGMTDALIASLASWPALRVISRQSVMRYKGSAKPLPEIAGELDVEGIVEGSVVRSGGRVRITAQLIHAPTDRHLWGRSYERRLEDVLALQDEVSRAIAAEIRITVATDSARRPARVRGVNAEAYDAYLLGRHHYNQRSPQSLEKAAAYFRSAIAKDPDFAAAYEGLATNYGPRIVSGDVAPDRARAEMKAAALKALELDPGLAEARADLAATLAYEWNWDGAEREYRRALEIDPNSLVANTSYGWYLYALGRFEEMLAVRRRALDLDPLDVAVNQSLARALVVTGQDEAAAAQWNRTMELDPNRLRVQIGFAFFLLEHGRTDLGWQQLERARALQPDEPVVLASFATAYIESGKPDQARRLLARLKEVSARRYVSPWFPALVHTALGEKDSAFAFLEQAFVAKDPLLLRIQNLDTMEGLLLPPERAAALRADPRFADLIRRMGFPRRDARASEG